MPLACTRFVPNLPSASETYRKFRTHCSIQDVLVEGENSRPSEGRPICGPFLRAMGEGVGNTAPEPATRV